VPAAVDDGGVEWIELGSHRLRGASAGSPPPGFLCLHGLADSLEIWDAMAVALAERGQLVRIDQRAHGESGAPPGPCRREDLADDAVRVLDHHGLERAVLVGHSMGGVVAMSAALERPDRVAGLVLIGTAAHCSAKAAAWYERIALAGERDGNVGLARAIYGAHSEKQIAGDARGIAQVTRALKSLHHDPLTPRLGSIRCPALVLVGERDPMGPQASASIDGELADSTLEVVPACGHWPHVEAPQVVLAAIDRWRTGEAP
jgi:3-oxoadipate enol-lactonase